MGAQISHSRMFETVIPLAVKYNLTVNSKFDEKDISGLAAEIKTERGPVLVAWEHGVIGSVLREPGIKGDLKWPSENYDSIWLVRFVIGEAIFSKDNEGLNLSSGCPYASCNLRNLIVKLHQ